jgi:ATP-dependent DNA ligase
LPAPEKGDLKMEQLYAKASTGKIKCWRVEALDGVMITHHGYLNGKSQTQSKPIKGKNIGRSNETTSAEQALKEAQSKWQKKVDKGYTTDPSGESDVRLPMKAQKFIKSGHHIKYPAFVQPKLNGVRCFAKMVGDTIEYTSRKGKSFNSTLQHLTPHLLKHMGEGVIFDGEIYNHDWNFQQIIRRVKKLRHDSNLLEFHIYDAAEEDSTFSTRSELLSLLGMELPLVFVKTEKIYNSEEVKTKHDEYVQNGYEGVMIRNGLSEYKFNHRDKNLQKYKEFIDDEFLIVGFHFGTGTEEGCFIFDVVTKSGKEFAVRPIGSREVKRRWVREFENIRGKWLMVRYQELSEEDKPIMPVGVAIRDYE